MKSNEMITKVAYEAPNLTEQGRVETETNGQSSGLFTDAGFDIGTPFSEVTFS